MLCCFVGSCFTSVLSHSLRTITIEQTFDLSVFVLGILAGSAQKPQDDLGIDYRHTSERIHQQHYKPACQPCVVFNYPLTILFIQVAQNP